MSFALSSVCSTCLSRLLFTSPSLRIPTLSPSIALLKLLLFSYFSWSMSPVKTYFIFSNKLAIIMKPTPQPVLILPPRRHEHPQLLVYFPTCILLNSFPERAFASYHLCSPRCVMLWLHAMRSKSTIAISSQKTLSSPMVGLRQAMADRNAKSSSSLLILACRPLMSNRLTWIAAVRLT